jgi:hypothetical protein
MHRGKWHAMTAVFVVSLWHYWRSGILQESAREASRSHLRVSFSVIRPGEEPIRQTTAHTLSRAKVLVEDNAVNLKLAVRLLGKYGCRVDIAAN